jgi:hypothetical protein
MSREISSQNGNEPSPSQDRHPESVAQLYKPTPRECALLVLHLIQAKEQDRGKEVTRLRVAEISLKRLWGRRRISPEFAEEVAEWLSSAGVTLFFAGSTYAVVRTSVVESWPRVTSKRISSDVRAVAQGTFDFSRLEHLMSVPGPDVGEDE